jgi:uncharacterized protein YwgA
MRLLCKVEGRKKLHKQVHILQELGYPFTEQFDYSYYGMFSRELRSEIGALVQENLIRETANPNMAGESTYTFESTPELEKFLDGLDVEKEPAWAALAKKLNALPTQMLEGISTILFLHRGGVEAAELQARFHALKPHLANIFEKCEQETKSLKMLCAASVST